MCAKQTPSLDAEALTEINNALAQWRQGDAVLGELDFIHLANLAAPLTAAAVELAGNDQLSGSGTDIGVVATKAYGLVVLSQSCDIVQPCAPSDERRSFVEVAPLVEVSDDVLALVKSAKTISLAYVPGVSQMHLVADLGRSMTVEKSVVASWTRVQGCHTDQEQRDFADALRRKRGRFAFPDAFIKMIDKFKRRVKDKHGKPTFDKKGNPTDEGAMLLALEEIRVRAEPSWYANDITLTFHFIKAENNAFAGPKWAEQVKAWLDSIPLIAPYVGLYPDITTHADMTAKDYIESDRLDFDDLS